VSSKSVELAEEQAYFDRAQKHRERRRAELGDTPGAAAHAGAAQRLLAWVKARKGAGRPADEAVAFGRVDDESRQTLYIGHEIITDEDREVLVVNWQAPAAQPYYQATHVDPRGLVRKRSFLCTGNQVTDFEDVVFQQLAKDVAALEGVAGLDDLDTLLLSELDRPREGSMRDIVATIQAAQYDLIRAPLDQVLVIEGGPGTGKTAVALHRVSHLLYNHQDRLGAADVLVVGPHPAFTSYIRTVLPSLGDAEVVHRDVGQLAPQVQRGRSEPVEASRLKGEARMARLLARALDARVGTPEPAERMLFDGRFVTLSGVEVSAVVAACRQAPGPYAQRRGLLRARLHDLARERGAPVDRERLEPVENLVDRLWPQYSAPAFLRGLLGSRRWLAAAAGDDLTPQEVALLQRKGADRLSNEVWSAADLPLLDEAEDLINGVSQRYKHVVVDEAQDLSPMQLRCVARRSATGSLTVVGDLAQSTGAWARDSWDDVLSHLPRTLPQNVVALRYGYRVPGASTGSPPSCCRSRHRTRRRCRWSGPGRPTRASTGSTLPNGRAGRWRSPRSMPPPVASSGWSARRPAGPSWNRPWPPTRPRGAAPTRASCARRSTSSARRRPRAWSSTRSWSSSRRTSSTATHAATGCSSRR